MTRRRLDSTVLTVALLGSLVLANVVGLGLFFRLDLTRHRDFTLSQATRETLEGLSDPLTIRAYFTKDLPPPHGSTARFVKDLLEEYYAASHGKLRYEFVDPTSEESDADKAKKKEVKADVFGRPVRPETSVEKELRQLGIRSVQVRVNEGDKLEVKRAYMGIVVQLGEKKEVLPVVRDTDGLEYDLTTAVRKVASQKAAKVALLGGHEGPEAKQLERLVGLLGQLHEVVELDLTKKPEVPEDVSVLVAVGPKKPFGEEEQKAIDRFLMAGHSAAFLVGSVAPDLPNLAAPPLDHGLAPLLEGYGAKLGAGLALDAECATINVTQQRGPMRVSQAVRYPYVPESKSLASHPITRGLGSVPLPFSGPVSLALPEGAGLQGEVLVKSSARSWVQQAPFNLDPTQQWTLPAQTESGAQGLMVALAGAFPSKFEPGRKAAAGARLLVANGYLFALDEFRSRDAEALLLNAVDWLAADDALLAVRTRGLRGAPLDANLSDGARNGLKVMNVVGLPLLLVAFGLVRWRLRESRRSRVTF